MLPRAPFQTELCCFVFREVSEMGWTAARAGNCVIVVAESGPGLAGATGNENWECDV